MNENIKKFIEKAIEDKELQEKMAACKNPEEAYEIANSVQEGFTMEEFIRAMQELYDLTHEGELTDEDLAKAAGGAKKQESSTPIYVTSVSVASLSIAYVSIEVTGALAGAAY